MRSTGAGYAICATLSYVRDFAFAHGCLDLIRKNREMAGSRDE